MAKVQGPLMSLGAKGSIGKGSVTFCNHKDDSTARHIPHWKKRVPRGGKDNQLLFKLAQIFWDNLPVYAKNYWEITTFNQPWIKEDSPWRAVVKGRLLFFRQACIRIKAGERPLMTPYDDSLAPIIHQATPVIYESE